MNDAFARLGSIRVLLYHNITPPHFFGPWDKEIHKILSQGLKGLDALASVTTLGLGDSEFNRAELAAPGLRPTGGASHRHRLRALPGAGNRGSARSGTPMREPTFSSWAGSLRTSGMTIS